MGSSVEGGYDESKYIPSEEAVKFISFIRAAGIEENANAEIHYRLADRYFSKNKRLLVESFRGSAKSSLIQWLVIYTAALGHLPGFGKPKFIVFIGDSDKKGVKNFFRNIVNKIDSSDFLKGLITIQRATDNEMELVNSEGYELDIAGYGASSNIRGINYKGNRPSIAILDDITTNEAMTSETIQQTINDNFYKAVLPALHPTKFKIFFIGTPISENDLISQLSGSDKWELHKFPVCEKFPCSEEDFKGAWANRFTYDAVLDIYETYKAANDTQSFYQEYMLELLDLSNLLVEDSDIKWFGLLDVVTRKGNYNYYITTDFATSSKKTADYSVISVWAVNNNEDWLLVDGQCLRQSMPENIDDLFRYVQKWNPLSVGIEVTGQQGSFIDFIQKEMIAKNIYFNLAKQKGKKDYGIRPTTDKLSRFVMGVQPRFKQGKIWLPREEDLKTGRFDKFKGLVDELLNELGKLTMAGGVKNLKHDDVIDTLNQMGEIDIIYPTLEDTMINNDGKVVYQDGYEWYGLDTESDIDNSDSIVF